VVDGLNGTCLVSEEQPSSGQRGLRKRDIDLSLERKAGAKLGKGEGETARDGLEQDFADRDGAGLKHPDRLSRLAVVSGRICSRQSRKRKRKRGDGYLPKEGAIRETSHDA